MESQFLRVAAILVLVICVAGAWAQQNADITVIVKTKSKSVDLPTLLVMCDLECSWKLDGEVNGHINAGGSAKIKVEPGQHMVEATTEDGIDQVKVPCIVKPTGQTMADIEFYPIRNARKQEASYEAAQAQAARQKALYEAAQVQAVMEQAERAAPFNAHQQAVALYGQKRYREALVLFQQACDTNLAQACGYLGFMYAKGQGIAKDLSRSLSFYSKACDAGSSFNCDDVGTFYEFGKGIQKDKEKAKEIYSKSCSMGDKTGCKWAEKIHLH